MQALQGASIFIKVENYISDEVGLPTLNDVILELEKPGRDVRFSIKIFEFFIEK